MIDYNVQRIDFNKSIINYIIKNHYSQTCPTTTKYAFGLYDKDRMIGVCLIGEFSRLQAKKKYKECLELTRLFIEDGTPKNTESYFIGHCLRWMKKNTIIKGIISYADQTVGHQGIVYQASNFQLINKTSRSYHYKDQNGNRVHKRGVWERAKKEGIKEKKQAEKENLTFVKEEQKLVYFYPLKKGFHFEQTDIAKRDELDQERYKFMTNWTRESAWVYGLILGDGYVHYTQDGYYNIGFAGNKDTVWKFERLLKIPHKNRQQGAIYTTSFYSDRIGQWFEARGIKGKKSHKLPWPTDIPDEFMWDFARGLIDTDGCFSLIKPHEKGKKGNDKISFGFTSATESFVHSFKDFIEKNIDVEIHAKYSGKNMNGHQYDCYSLGTRVFAKVIEIGLKLYDCPDKIRNDQKYRDFKEGQYLWNKLEKGCLICGKKIKSKYLCSEHYFFELKRNKEPKYCFCGLEAYVEKYELCSQHYHLYMRRRKEKSSITLEEFKANPQRNSTHKEYDAISFDFRSFDETKSCIVVYKEYKYLIDIEDLPFFKSRKWRVSKKWQLFSAMSGIRVYFHRDIMNVEKDKFVVPKNRNPFDLRKENLVILTNAEMIRFTRYLLNFDIEGEIIDADKIEPILIGEKTKCLECESMAEWKGLCRYHYMKKYKEEKNRRLGIITRPRRSPVKKEDKKEICEKCNKNKTAVGNLCRRCWSELKKK